MRWTWLVWAVGLVATVGCGKKDAANAWTDAQIQATKNQCLQEVHGALNDPSKDQTICRCWVNSLESAYRPEQLASEDTAVVADLQLKLSECGKQSQENIEFQALRRFRLRIVSTFEEPPVAVKKALGKVKKKNPAAGGSGAGGPSASVPATKVPTTPSTHAPVTVGVPVPVSRTGRPELENAVDPLRYEASGSAKLKFNGLRLSRGLMTTTDARLLRTGQEWETEFTIVTGRLTPGNGGKSNLLMELSTKFTREKGQDTLSVLILDYSPEKHHYAMTGTAPARSPNDTLILNLATAKGRPNQALFSPQSSVDAPPSHIEITNLKIEGNQISGNLNATGLFGLSELDGTSREPRDKYLSFEGTFSGAVKK
jgi:hypothetical protein